jgi:hypothetical protein
MLTIKEFKDAIRADGNLRWIINPGSVLNYITRAIDGARSNRQITEAQNDKLYDWAHDVHESIAKRNQRKAGL